ncbi:MAG: hypothetical protein ACM3ML_34105 [Micromonosporaceae bacterium]
MIRSSAIRLITIAAAAVAIPALTGCAAGMNAQTTRPFNATDGTSANFHGIAIRNMFVLGPTAGSTLAPGQSASLFVALVNDGTADQLTTAAAPGTASSVTIKGGTVRLSAGQAALLTGPAPQLILERLTKPLTGGQTIPVTLVFQNAGAVTLRVPVLARGDYYATFLSPPSPSPSPSATGTRSKKAPASPSPGSSGSATPSPSATP